MRYATFLIGILVLTGVDPRAAQAPDLEPPARRSWGDYWGFWGRSAQVIWRAITAPKLHYRVEALEVYPNGVWAEFGITNRTGKGKYLDTRFVSAPVANIGLADAEGRDWQVPQFKGDFGLGAADQFVYFPAGGTVWYRHRLTFVDNKPLELVRPAPADKQRRPRDLTYWIMGWTYAYTRLTEGGKERMSAWSFGGGRVPVQWFDKPYPSDWPVQTRYFGSKAAK